ncbi:MAG: hypothetical protein ACTSWE_02475 [Promethearchaeota archaeon]
MNPNQYLEKILIKISITPERKKYIKNCIKKIHNEFSQVEPNCYGYRYGGSFDRYTCIRNYFDVDVYFKGYFEEYNLLSNFEYKLRDLEEYYVPFEIARGPPYLHAIPCLFNNDIELDLIPAIELNRGFLRIPEGGNTIVINPELDEEKLNDLNKKNNGLGTKLIKLLKKWNYINGKCFKSYQLEALAYYIFEGRKISSLDKGLKTFFGYGINLIDNGYELYDEIDNHSILRNLDRELAVELMGRTANLMNENKWTIVFPTI